MKSLFNLCTAVAVLTALFYIYSWNAHVKKKLAISNVVVGAPAVTLSREPADSLLLPTFFVPREVAKVPLRGAVEPLGICPGTSEEIPWDLWGVTLGPLRGT